MSKIWLITQREYATRVRNKTFLLSTFMLPIVLVLFIAGTVVLAVQGKSRHRIAVIDAGNYIKDYLKSDSAIVFDFSPGLDSSNYEAKGCSAALIVPSAQILSGGRSDSAEEKRGLQEESKGIAEEKRGIPATIYIKYKKQLGLNSDGDLQGRIRSALRDRMVFEETRISPERLDSLRKKAGLTEIKTLEDNGRGSNVSSQVFSYAIGYASGFLIYILTFIYGAAVMRGVMEEKTNRIAEVMVGSVRPFELMFGKIAGIGAVGLTQFLLWILLIAGLSLLAQAFIPHDVLQQVQQLQEANAMGGSQVIKAGEQARKIYEYKTILHSANWGLILFCFLFYFLGGYLFYSALFAAVGSAVNEDPQEAQSLMLPITMPVIFSFIIMSIAVQDPGGSLAVWASILPFSSPIVMMARIPAGVPGTVPWWQLILSMVLLVAGFLFTVWMAGRIYRTGILLYGKKPSWLTLLKWVFRKA